MRLGFDNIEFIRKELFCPPLRRKYNAPWFPAAFSVKNHFSPLIWEISYLFLSVGFSIDVSVDYADQTA